MERPWLSEAEGFKLPNHDTGKILPPESQMKVIDPSATVTESSATEYDSANESSVCGTSLPSLEKLACVTINEPSSTPAKINKNVSASKNNSALVGKMKNVKTEDDFPLSILDVIEENIFIMLLRRKCELVSISPKKPKSSLDYYVEATSSGSSLRSKTSRPSKPFPPYIHCGFNDHMSDDYVNYPICDIYGSYDHDTHGHNMVISLRRGIKPRNPQHVTKSCETCGSIVHTTTDHNDIEWFRRGEALQTKKAEAFQSKSSNAIRSKTPTKSYLHKYVEQPGPKVVFGDDSTCITKGYGSIKCNGIVFIKVAFVNGLKYNLVNISQLCDAKYIVQFDEKIGTIFNSNKEIVMISSRVRDVYVLGKTSSAQESCFFAKATKNLN
ncbi:hypothetical protein Tco_0014959 [Tanacetum coccineum]